MYECKTQCMSIKHNTTLCFPITLMIIRNTNERDALSWLLKFSLHFSCFVNTIIVSQSMIITITYYNNLTFNVKTYTTYIYIPNKLGNLVIWGRTLT